LTGRVTTSLSRRHSASGHPDLLYDARTYALVIGAVGLVNLALAVKPTPSPAA